jgi:hypothetical protein
MNTQQEQPKEWIIQRCIDAWKNQYEDWPGYCEKLMTHDEMMVALKKCEEKWIDEEFRGHRAVVDGVPREIYDLKIKQG